MILPNVHRSHILHIPPMQVSNTGIKLNKPIKLIFVLDLNSLLGILAFHDRWKAPEVRFSHYWLMPTEVQLDPYHLSV